jgi:DNA-binding cell septation regulator SpoVG
MPNTTILALAEQLDVDADAFVLTPKGKYLAEVSRRVRAGEFGDLNPQEEWDIINLVLEAYEEGQDNYKTDPAASPTFG